MAVHVLYSLLWVYKNIRMKDYLRKLALSPVNEYPWRRLFRCRDNSSFLNLIGFNIEAFFDLGIPLPLYFIFIL